MALVELIPILLPYLTIVVVVVDVWGGKNLEVLGWNHRTVLLVCPSHFPNVLILWTFLSDLGQNHNLLYWFCNIQDARLLLLAMIYCVII